MARVKWRLLDPTERRCQGTSSDRDAILPMSDSKHETADRLPPSLHFEQRGAVGILRLSRPHKRNALDDATIRGIEDFFAAVRDDIKAVVLENSPSPHNPLGAKGAGEGGIVPVGGVVANAVASALKSFGAEPRELPLSPPKIWALIQQSSK